MALHGRFPYLSFPRQYRPEDYAAADAALEAAGAADLAGRMMDTLSGGQRQKVYLAMALAQQAPTILMDEPTTWLDPRHQLEVMATARRLAAEGRAVGLVSHELSLALRTADRVALLAGGKLAAFGTPRRSVPVGRAGRRVRRQNRPQPGRKRLALLLSLNEKGPASKTGCRSFCLGRLPEGQLVAFLVDEGDAAVAEIPALAVEGLMAVGAQDVRAVGQGDEGPVLAVGQGDVHEGGRRPRPCLWRTGSGARC